MFSKAKKFYPKVENRTESTLSWTYSFPQADISLKKKNKQQRKRKIFQRRRRKDKEQEEDISKKKKKRRRYFKEEEEEEKEEELLQCLSVINPVDGRNVVMEKSEH